MARHDDDFGFSFFTDDEMKANEKTLSEQLAATKTKASMAELDVTQIKNKVDEIKAAIMPFLNNLLADPQKVWMKWPNRAKQVQSFIDKLEKI